MYICVLLLDFVRIVRSSSSFDSVCESLIYMYGEMHLSASFEGNAISCVNVYRSVLISGEAYYGRDARMNIQFHV